METFGSVLSRILLKNDMSMNELTRRLGMKSRTTLSRIMRDETTYETAAHFRDRLVAANVMRLSDAELEQMERALEQLDLEREALRRELDEKGRLDHAVPLALGLMAALVLL